MASDSFRRTFRTGSARTVVEHQIMSTEFQHYILEQIGDKCNNRQHKAYGNLRKATRENQQQGPINTSTQLISGHHQENQNFGTNASIETVDAQGQIPTLPCSVELSNEMDQLLNISEISEDTFFAQGECRTPILNGSTQGQGAYCSPNPYPMCIVDSPGRDTSQGIPIFTEGTEDVGTVPFLLMDAEEEEELEQRFVGSPLPNDSIEWGNF